MSPALAAPVPLTARLNPMPAAVRLVNRIALVIDGSSSMYHLRSKVIRYANEQINRIKLAAADSGQITELSVLTFSDRHDLNWLASHEFPEAVPLLHSGNYRADGGATALFDAVKDAVENLDSRPRGLKVSYLVITITDGEDNSSDVAPRHFAAEIQRLQRGAWSFAFLGPEGLINVLTSRGVPAGNIAVWDQTEAGLEAASQKTAQSIGNYYDARAAGQVKTAAFFTELGTVTKRAVQQKLKPVDLDFNRIPVPKEMTIREAVEAAGHRFQIGRGFYELTKPEKVQSHKDFVLMDRKGGRLFGGPEARRLLAIPDGPGVTVKVAPGNHGDWRVFVSSTSTNRKLVRGTTLLYKVR